MIQKMFYGFCMAMADSVPGVSGGSIAFLLGFYDKFITSLNHIISREKEEWKEAFLFLAKLGIGWVIGMGLAVTLLSAVFEQQIYEVSSLFLGFIVVAIFVMCWEHRLLSKVSVANVVATACGIGLVVLITVFQQSANLNIDLVSLTPLTVLYIFLAAMVAISAMVLPGISGSTLLLVFGLYVPVISAIRSLMHLDFTVFPALVVFGLGVLTGIILFVRWIKMALEKFPSTTMYAIIGLMTGSLYSIVMGPTTLKIPQSAMNLQSFRPVFFLLGAALVLLMEGYKHYQSSARRQAMKKIAG